MQESKTKKNFPRRFVMEEMTKEELLITNTISEVEKLGADEKLTDAILKLIEAKDLISDFVESK